MTRHLHIEPVDLVDLLAAEWAQEERAIASHRATRLSARAEFHRLGHTASVAIAIRAAATGLGKGLLVRRSTGGAGARNPSTTSRIISGDCFFLIAGAMVALDLCLIVWLVQR